MQIKIHFNSKNLWFYLLFRFNLKKHPLRDRLSQGAARRGPPGTRAVGSGRRQLGPARPHSLCTFQQENANESLSREQCFASTGPAETKAEGCLVLATWLCSRPTGVFSEHGQKHVRFTEVGTGHRAQLHAARPGLPTAQASFPFKTPGAKQLTPVHQTRRHQN